MNFIKSREGLLLLLAVLLIGGSIWYYYATTEPYTERIETGFTGMARRNSFLALDYLMKEMGDSSESITKLDYNNFLYGPDAIFMPLERIPAQPGKLKILRQWLESGGILITGSTGKYDKDDQIYLPESVRSFIGVNSITVLDTVKTVNFEDAGFKVKFPLAFDISLRGYRNTVENNGHFLAGVKNIGQGNVIFFNSLKAFNNDNLGEEENANYLYNWLDRYDIFNMKIVYAGYDTSMWSWLWTNAFLSIMVLAAFVLAWILKVTRRFGPVKPPFLHGSRKIMEHIETAGAYYWSGNLQSTLLKNLQKSILDKVKLSYPSWINDKSLNDELSRLTGLTRAEIENGMDNTGSQANEEQFLVQVRTLRKIKECL